MVAMGLGEEGRLKAAQEVKSAGDGEMGGEVEEVGLLISKA